MPQEGEQRMNEYIVLDEQLPQWLLVQAVVGVGIVYYLTSDPLRALLVIPLIYLIDDVTKRIWKLNKGEKRQ